MGTLREHIRTFTEMSSWIRLRMRNISHKICRKKIKLHILRSSKFFRNRVVYEIMSKNMVQLDRSQMTMCII